MNTYLSPPVDCERLETIVARDGGTWNVQPQDSQVDYTLPANASEELREFLRPLTSAIFPPDFLAWLPYGRVFGPGVVLSADGRSVARDVSVDFGKPFQQHWLLKYQEIRPPVPRHGTTLVVATALASGYSHWLLEELPRLLRARDCAFDAVIAHAKSAFSLQAFKLLGLNATIVPARRYSHFVCDQLIVPSLLGQPGFPTPRMLELLDGFTATVRAESIVAGERLYVSREKARRRRVTNEPELWNWLKSRGFVKLCPEDLSWAEQIQVFRHAKVVVGPHGAGLANLAFCAAGTKVVELFHRSYINSCYWRLSSVRGLEYVPITAEGDAPLEMNIRANRLDFSVQVDQIARALATA